MLTEEYRWGLVKAISSSHRGIAIERLMKWLEDKTISNQEKASFYVQVLNGYMNSNIRDLIEIVRIVARKGTEDDKYNKGWSEFGFDHSQDTLAKILKVADEDLAIVNKVMMELPQESTLNYEDMEQIVLGLITRDNLKLLHKGMILMMLWESVSVSVSVSEVEK